MAYRVFVSLFYKKLDSVVHNLAIKETSLNPAIISWMKTYSKYRRAEDLLEYGRHYKGNLPTGYYDFLRDYVKGPKDIQCSQYYEDFLQNYYPYKFSQYDQAKTMYAYRKDGDYFSYLQLLMKEISKNETVTPELELALSQICYRVAKKDAKSMVKAFPQYSQLVKNEYFKRLVKEATGEQMYLSSKGKLKTLDQLATMDHIGLVFSEIKKAHKGKVLYLDFWGTWCRPCLAEFPYSRMLHQELEDKDIAFIYFCCLSEETAWKTMKNRHQLTGMHFLLNIDQYQATARLFNINSLPRYMVINKKGVIVAEDASRPSGKKTKAQLLQWAD